MNCFIDLSKQAQEGNISNFKAACASLERASNGISHIDMMDFELFFDEMLQSAFKIFSRTRNINFPNQFTKEDWYDNIDSVYSKCCMLHENHIKLYECNVKDFKDTEEYVDFCNNIKAENYALRSEILDFIRDYIEDIYIYE